MNLIPCISVCNGSVCTDAVIFRISRNIDFAAADFFKVVPVSRNKVPLIVLSEIPRTCVNNSRTCINLKVAVSVNG